MNRKRSRNRPILLIGATLLTVGIIWLLDAILEANIWEDFWPAVLIVVGLGIGLRGGLFLFLGLFLVLVSVVVLILNLFDVPIRWDILLPLIFIIVGAMILTYLLLFRRVVPKGTAKEKTANISALFSSGKHNPGGDLEFISVTSLFGGPEISLAGVTAGPNGLQMDVLCMFGSIQIVVDDTWEVDAQTSGVAGSIDDKRLKSGTTDKPNKLTLSGSVMFGSMEISQK